MNRKAVSVVLAPCAATLLLAGCVTTTNAPAVVSAPQQPGMPRVYFYPLQGQGPQQQDRDRYDCFTWAGTQTGFDPSREPLPRETREVLVPARPTGALTLAGAATGALLGAAVSDPWDRGEGALIGAAAGTVIGAVAESAQPQYVSSASQRRHDTAASGYGQKAAGFERAMSACLEGRGYAVK